MPKGRLRDYETEGSGDEGSEWMRNGELARMRTEKIAIPRTASTTTMTTTTTLLCHQQLIPFRSDGHKTDGCIESIFH